jgi:hypothetical protein
MVQDGPARLQLRNPSRLRKPEFSQSFGTLRFPRRSPVTAVGKALGLIKPETEFKSKSERKAERKAAIARAIDTKKNR